MNRHECDDKAHDITWEIMKVATGPKPPGGALQRLAQVQVLVIEAMLWAAGEQAKQGEGQ